MQSARKANQALLAVLGIDAIKRRITAIDIEIRPTSVPVAHVTELLDGLGLSATRRFSLVPLDQADQPAPYDLDAMCDQARASVQRTIYMATINHLLEMAASSPLNRQVKAWTAYDRAVDRIARWDIPQVDLNLEGLA